MKLKKETKELVRSVQQQYISRTITLVQVKKYCDQVLPEINVIAKKIAQKHHKKFIPFTHKEVLKMMV